MPQTVTVLKPFVFTFPPRQRREKLATEMPVKPNRDPITKEWIPTEVELPDEVAQHPFIREHFADGAIERPEHTRQRLETAEAKRKQELDAAQLIIAQANAALARASVGHETTKVREGDVERDLNTPVNELQRRQGADISPPVVEGALENGNEPTAETPKNGKKGKGNKE